MKHLFLGLIALLGLLLMALPLLPPSLAGSFIYVSLLGVPLMLLQLLIAIVLFVKKQHPWRWIYISLCAANIPLMYQYCPSQEAPEPDSDRSLTFVSWNATNFHIQADTLRAAAAFIRAQQPDIICLQEVPHNNLLPWDSIRAAFPEHPYQYKNERDDEVLNLGILSRYPLSDIRTHYFDPGYNKMASLCVTTPLDTFRLWNVHLQTTGHPTRFVDNARERNRQARLLRQYIEADSLLTLVCGDLNDNPASYTYRTLKRGRKDAYRQKGQRYTGSYQPLGDWLRIDYLFCPHSSHVLRYELLENPWSDHKMQVATIDL